MAKQLHCDRFRQEQFVPTRQIRTLLTVYIANLAQRRANNGLGCAVKDLFSGEEKKLKVAALTKMGLCFPNGKKVKAHKLRGGQTYTMLGTPEQPNYGVFIVPRGTNYVYMFKGQPLPPGSCILWDGKQSKVIGYRLFRKLFIMGQNPISAGHMKRAGQANQFRAGQPQQFRAEQPQQFRAEQPQQFRAEQPQQFRAEQPQQFRAEQPQQPHSALRQNYVQPQAPQQSYPTSPTQYVAMGRLLRNGELVGLLLSNGVQQVRVPFKQCLDYAERGEVKNVKAVLRNGTKFLSGNGISLESLPFTQV